MFVDKNDLERGMVMYEVDEWKHFCFNTFEQVREYRIYHISTGFTSHLHQQDQGSFLAS
jgi:hypothetical protein